MKGKGLTKADKARHDIMRDIGCIICKDLEGCFTPTAIHHIDGKTKAGAHQKTLGLCFWHHMADQQQPKTPAYTSRHPDKTAFEARYGSEAELLERQNELIAEYENNH